MGCFCLYLISLLTNFLLFFSLKEPEAFFCTPKGSKPCVAGSRSRVLNSFKDGHSDNSLWSVPLYFYSELIGTDIKQNRLHIGGFV